ncbi:MAG: hypothetical protein ACM3QS_09205 [Bacteroidota bacterium]
MAIARIWRGITLAANADSYSRYVDEFVVPAHVNAAGNAGLILLQDPQGELVHFLLLSFWTSEEAVEGFAGVSPCDLVAPCPGERKLLLAFESTARHYQVVYAFALPPPGTAGGSA